MSATFTMYGREFMQKALFTPDNYTMITNLEVALCRFAPAANASISQLTEPTVVGSGYARAVYGTGHGTLASTGVAV